MVKNNKSTVKYGKSTVLYGNFFLAPTVAWLASKCLSEKSLYVGCHKSLAKPFKSVIS